MFFFSHVKIEYFVHVEAVLTSNHNLYFGAKIMNTLVLLYYICCSYLSYKNKNLSDLVVLYQASAIVIILCCVTYGLQSGWTYDESKMTPSRARLSRLGVYMSGLCHPTSFQPKNDYVEYVVLQNNKG